MTETPYAPPSLSLESPATPSVDYDDEEIQSESEDMQEPILQRHRNSTRAQEQPQQRRKKNNLRMKRRKRGWYSSVVEESSSDEEDNEMDEDYERATGFIDTGFRYFLAGCIAVILLVIVIYAVIVFLWNSVPYSYIGNPFLLFVEASSDALIAFAYFIIPFLLIFLVRNRKDLPFNWIFLMFGGFILSCGMTHFVNTFGPWVHPQTRIVIHERSLWFTILSACVKTFTAIISLITAVASFGLMPLALKLPSPTRLQKEVDTRKQAEHDLQNQYERSLLISSITNKIRNSFHTQDIFQIAATQIGSVMRASRCTIHRYKRSASMERAHIPCEAEYLHPNFPSKSFLDVDLPITGFMTQVLANDDVLVVRVSELLRSDDDEDRLVGTILSRYEVRSIMCVRTSYQGSPNGIVMLHQCKGNRTKWTTEDMRFLKDLAAQLGIALQQTYLLERERQRYELEIQNVKLEKAKETAERENKAKSEFLLMMSHEVRTPCNAIIGMNTLLQKSELNNEQFEITRIIEDSGNLLVEIINSFLDFSKLESGKLELQMQPFHLSHALKGCIDMFVMNAKKERDITVQLNPNHDIPKYIIGDKFRFQQILINLISNGVKFTESGGEVAVNTEVVSQESDQIIIQFSVTDTGIGIPENQIQYLFQPFSQVHSSGMTRRCGGSGLGLSICKKLCELMSGRIWVTTKSGKGSTFHFILPFGVCAPSPDSNDPSEYGGITGVSKPETETNEPTLEIEPNFDARILIAEDNIINKKVVVSLLNKIGYRRVDVVSDGKMAVEAVQRENIDKKETQEYEPFSCILMDLMMPELDGIEATKIIREMLADSNEEHLNIIALTANIQTDIQCQCKEAGFDEFLSKPFKLDQLEAVMKIYN